MYHHVHSGACALCALHPAILATFFAEELGTPLHTLPSYALSAIQPRHHRLILKIMFFKKMEYRLVHFTKMPRSGDSDDKAAIAVMVNIIHRCNSLIDPKRMYLFYEVKHPKRFFISGIRKLDSNNRFNHNSAFQNTNSDYTPFR